jgi:hypothetical protein
VRGLLTTTYLFRRLQQFRGGRPVRGVETPCVLQDRRDDLIPARIQPRQQPALLAQRPGHAVHETHPNPTESVRPDT